MARSTRAVVSRQKSVQTTWLRNAMKSVGISSKNVLKEIAPNIYEATEAGINTSKNVANAIRGAKSGNLTRTLQNDKYVQFAQKAYKNAISDLRSGKLNNQERMEEVFSGSSDLQEVADGFTFGDDGADSVKVNVIGDTGNTSGAILSLGNTIQKQTETQLKVQKANMDAYVSLSAASMQQTGQIGAEIIGQLSSINSNLAAMVQYNNENMNRFIEASLAYYEKVGPAITNGQNGSGNNGKLTAHDVLNGRNGGINISRYKSYVKQQLKDTIDKSELGLLKSMLDDQMLDMMASNPLGFLTEGMIRMVAPTVLTSTIKSVEETFSNVVPSALMEVSRWANDPKSGLVGSLKRTIGSIFGLSLDKRGTVRGGVSIERGPIAFDGETKHAITEIITGELRTQTAYLEIIASHYKSDAKRYARDNARHWDWNKNQYTNRQGINRGIAEEYVNAVSGAFNDSNFGRGMKKVLNGRDDSEREYLEQGLKEIYTALNRYEGNVDTKVLLDIISKTGLTNEAKTLLHKHVKSMVKKDPKAYDNLSVARLNARHAGSAAKRNISENASSYGYFQSDFINVDNAEEEDLLIDEIMGYGGRNRRRRTTGFRTALDYRSENVNGKPKAGKAPRKFDNIDPYAGQQKTNQIRGKIGRYISDTGAYVEGMMRSLTQPNGAAAFIENLSGLVAKNVSLMGEKVGSILFGDESEGKKGIFTDTIESFKSSSKEMFSKVTGALNQGIDSLMDGLFGSKGKKDKDGNLVGRMDRFKNWLFGEKDEHDERTGGFIKKETQQFFKENKGSIALSTASGAITGGGVLGALVGGPVAGALMGMGGAIIKRSGIFQRFLFGSEKNGQKGLFKGISDAWARSKKEQDKEVTEMSSGAKGLLGSIIGAGAGTVGAGILSNMGILGASLSPLGPIGGAIIGLGAGISAQGKTFSEWLFGKEDGLDLGDGRTAKEQGVLGQVTNALKANFINPLKSKLSYIIESTAITLEHNVLTPISLVAEAVTEKVGNFVRGIGNSASNLLNKVADRIGKGFETLFSPVVNLVSGSIEKVASAASATFNTLVSLPANLIRAGIKGLNIGGKIKEKLGNLLSPVLDPVKNMVHKVTDTLTAGIKGMLQIGIKGIGSIIGGVTAPVRWLGGLAAAGIRTAGAKLKDKLGDRYKESKLFGPDGTIAERFLNSGMTEKRDREELKKMKEINKRHDKNAQFIAKHTKNQFAEDTKEARQYLRKVNPRAYLELMNMYGDQGNTSIDEENRTEKFGASVANMKASDVSKQNVDKLDNESRQVYYLQGIFNIMRGKNWDGSDAQEGENPILTASEKAANGEFDSEDPNTTGTGNAYRGMDVKEYMRHTKRSLHAFMHGEDTLQDSAGNLYRATLGGKYEVYDANGDYKGTIKKNELPSDVKKADNNDDRASFVDSWKKTFKDVGSSISTAWMGKKKKSNEENGGNGGFGDGDENEAKIKARMESVKRREDALAKAREAGTTAAELQAKIAAEEEEKESDEQHDAVIEALGKNSDATEKHNKEWSSIFGKTGLITVGLIAGITLLKNKFPELLDGLTSIFNAIKTIAGGAVEEAVDQASFTNEHATRTNGNTAGEEAGYLFDEMTNGNLFTDKDGNVVGRTDSLAQFGARRLLNFKFADNVNPLSSKFNKGEKAIYRQVKKVGKGAKSILSKGKQWLTDANTIAEWTAEYGDEAYELAKGSVQKITAKGINKINQGKQWLKDTNTIANLTAEYGDEAYDLASGSVQKATAKGLEKVKTSSVGKAVSKAASATDDVLKTVKGYVKEFFNFIKTKLGAKTGKTIGKKAFGEVTEEAIETGLEKGWKKIGGKIAAKLTSGATGAALTAGLSEVAFATIGAINGASGTAKLFHVDSSAVDGTMTVISTVFGALAGTTVGGIIDIVFTLLSPILGIDILNCLAVGLYNFLVGEDSKKAAKLQSAQEAFEGAYLEDRKTDLEDQYKAQLAAGLIGKDVTLDMFIAGVEDGTYSANYTSFDDYNAQKNASLGDKIISGGSKVIKGIGNGLGAAGDFIFGSEKETYTDANGTTYVKNRDGMYDVTLKDGTKVGAISADAVPKDATKTVEKSKNILQRAGDGLTSLGKTVGEGVVKLSDEFGAKLEETKEKLSGIGSTMMEGLKSAGSSIVGGFKSFVSNGKSLVSDVGSYISTLKGYADNDEDIASMDEITINGAEGDPIRSIIGPMIQGPMKFYVNMKRGFTNIGKSIGETVSGGIDTICDALGLEGVKEKVSKFGDSVKEFGKSVKDKVSDGWESLKEGAGKVWNNIFGGNGGGFGGYGTYYSQYDPRWKNAAYNTGNDNATMGEAGCGPTAMAMAASDITGRNINPMQMASLAKATGNRDSTGTNWNFIGDSSRALGIDSTQAINPSASYISRELEKGNPVVLSGQTGGYGFSPYTPAGHYVVAVGKDSNGNVLINDPRGRSYSGKYNLNAVASETGSAWSFGGNGYRRRPLIRGGRGMVSALQRTMVGDTGVAQSVLSTKKSVDSHTQWVYIIRAVKQAMAAPKVGYSQSRWIPITIGGKTLSVRTDCSGFTTACLKFFGVLGDDVNLTSYNYANGNNSTLRGTGFTPMNWIGWENLREGDIIAKGGHVEIFAYNDGNTHYVYNCGSDASNNNPNATRSGSPKYDTVWRDGAAGDAAITDYAYSYDSSGISGSSSEESLWSKLFNGVTGFFSEFGTRALSGILSGDWSNTDYSKIWNGTSSSSSSSGGSSSNGSYSFDPSAVSKIATGSAGEANLWKNLNAAIGNNYGTAGLMGNLAQESGLNSKNLQNTGNKKLGMSDDQYTNNVDTGAYSADQFVNDKQGYGLAQWTYWSRKRKLLDYAKSIGASIGDQNMQTDYLIHELKTGYPDVWSDLTNARSIRDASNSVLMKFERPADQGSREQTERANDGQSYYDMYAGGKGGGFGNGASIGRTRYYKPAPRRTQVHGGRGYVNYGSTGTINSRASQNQYNNYMNSSNYLTARKNASVNELMITVIEILSDIAGNTRISSDKLDLLKNIQSGNTVVVGGNTSHSNNAFNSFSSNKGGSQASKSDISAMKIASGSGY